MSEYMHISEKFYSLQGEGVTMGVPAVFVRLSGCNLLCEGSGWTCDTIEVWKRGTQQMFEDILNEDMIARLFKGAHLIFTGGEPLLQQQKIGRYLIWFVSKYGFMPVVEIETNGTIEPNSYLLNVVKYWNCSPKLKSSGESLKRRVNVDAIKALNKSRIQTCFKFVITSEDDILELLETYSVGFSKIVLMPAGSTQEELNKTRPIVVDLAIRTGFRYCDRLHIVIWNKKTGV